MTVVQRSPKEQRERIRQGLDRFPTTGMCAGYTQANLVILPKKYAFDFLLFANRNPKPCPIVDVLESGKTVPNIADSTADICTDIGKYRVFKQGVLVDEVEDITSYWKDDFVSFLIGCSYTFENALEKAGIEMLFRKSGNNVAMYKTNISCHKAGIFHGPLVVSMRPVLKRKLVSAVEVTSKFIHTHGSPIHIGDPHKVGIKDITKPDYGDFTTYDEEEYAPVFWACGVTPQEVAKTSKPEIMITHAPGYMFISDRKETL